MRRSAQLTITVLCPHFERPVAAKRDAISERLVDCESKGECVVEETRDGNVKVAVFPQGCPVFRART